jgi:hypothetical protein
MGKVHPNGGGIGDLGDGDHGDGELFGNVHHEIHLVNACEQIASELGELGELGEHYSEPCEDDPNITPPGWTPQF